MCEPHLSASFYKELQLLKSPRARYSESHTASPNTLVPGEVGSPFLACPRCPCPFLDCTPGTYRGHAKGVVVSHDDNGGEVLTSQPCQPSLWRDDGAMVTACKSISSQKLWGRCRRPCSLPSSPTHHQFHGSVCSRPWNSKWGGGSFIKEGPPVYQASIKPTMQPWMALRSNPPASVSQVCATRPDFCGAGQVPGSPPPLACHPGAGTHLHAGDQPVAHCLALGSAGHHLETVGRGCVQQHWGQKGQVTWAQLGWILQTQRPKTAPATTETHHTL